jgi:hypothetical protein
LIFKIYLIEIGIGPNDNNLQHPPQPPPPPPPPPQQSINNQTYKINDNLIIPYHHHEHHQQNQNNSNTLDLTKNYSLKNLVTTPQQHDFNDISSFGTLNTLATVAAQSAHLNNQDMQYTASNTQSKVNFVVSIPLTLVILN